MKLIICQGTLKKQAADSNTTKLVEMFGEECRNQEIQLEVVEMAALRYEPGTSIKTQSGAVDDLTLLISKIVAADGLIIATPIWWNNHSSLVQALIERMDGLDNWSLDNQFWPLYGKVFGCIISGSSDGVQSLAGNLFNWAVETGFTVPPQCSIWSYGQRLEEIQKDKEFAERVKVTCTNLLAWHTALKANKTGLRVQV
jgi:multimeric flavodoxin WrbA